MMHAFGSSAIRSEGNGGNAISTEKNVQTVKDFFAAIGGGDREGLLALVAEDTRRTIDRTLAVRLCRCGQSNDKPFCDGSHRAAEFKADGRGA